MDQYKSVQNLQKYLAANSSKKIGYVPTMGTLHEGHLSLIRASKEANDLTICSIFLNPLQFNSKEDLKKYPNTREFDIKTLEQEGCDILFMPDYEELFPTEPKTKMSFGSLENNMEGKFRPGHFSGVGVIVNKFFQIIRPTKAYFGQKDLQQFAIIKQMVKDLSIAVELEMLPVVREKDGLAMSSRNLRLSEEERAQAPFLYKQLVYASQNIKMKSIFEVKKNIISAFARSPFELEYFEVVDTETLQPLKNVRFPLALCIAASLGNIRLIDNVIVKN